MGKTGKLLALLEEASQKLADQEEICRESADFILSLQREIAELRQKNKGLEQRLLDLQPEEEISDEEEKSEEDF